MNLKRMRKKILSSSLVFLLVGGMLGAGNLTATAANGDAPGDNGGTGTVTQPGTTAPAQPGQPGEGTDTEAGGTGTDLAPRTGTEGQPNGGTDTGENIGSGTSGATGDPSAPGNGNGSGEGEVGTSNGEEEQPPAVLEDLTFKLTSPEKEWVTPKEAKATVEIKDLPDSRVLKSFEVEVNGERFLDGVLDSGNPKKELDFSTANIPEDGVLKVKFTAVEESGKTQFVEFQMKVDNTNPVYSHGQIEGTGHLKEDTFHSNKAVKLQVRITDTGSGVDRVHLARNAVDRGVHSGVRGTSTQLEKKSNTADLYEGTIFEDGLYELEVVDVAGNTTTVPLYQVDGVPGKYRFSEEKPSVVLTVNDAEYNGEWVTTKPTIVKAAYQDKVGLTATTMKVNGQVVDRGLNTHFFGNSELQVDLGTLPVPQDGVYNIVAEVNNIFSNGKTTSMVVKADYSKPTVTAVSSSNGAEIHDGKMYSNKPIAVTINSTDQGSGVKQIVVTNRDTGETVIDKGITGTGHGEIGSVSFNIEKNGGFDVRVVDEAGNSVESKLEDLVNKPEYSGVVIDTGKPELGMVTPLDGKDGVKVGEKTWFGVMPEGFELTATDDNLKSVEVEANGVVVYTGSENLNNTKITLGDKVKPNKDGGVTVQVRATDKAGNTSEKSFTFHVDVDKPSVERVDFYAPNGGVAPGKVKEDQKSREKAWVYFLQNSVNLKITANDSDGVASAGLKSVEFVVESEGGDLVRKTMDLDGNSAVLPLGDNFKGFVDIQVIDNVGHKSPIVNSNGVIIETLPIHVNTANVGIELPKPVGTDINGVALYNQDITAQVKVTDSRNGVQKLTWGTNLDGVSHGSQGVSNTGESSGVFSVDSKDRNIATSMSGGIGVSADSNQMTLKVIMEDNSGYTTENSKVFSIDKTAPEVTVGYDVTNANGFYNTNRVANISVVDRNFSPDRVVIYGTPGNLGTWKSLEDGVTWANTMSFTTDLDYEWGIQVTDLAGNQSKKVESGKFTVDKTAPELSVIFDNNNVKNGKFYKNARVATLTVVDKNFQGNNGGATISGGNSNGWNAVGNSHQTTVGYTSDGEYSLGVKVVDQAGNVGTDFSSGEFVVDQTAPVLNISGVQNGAAYRKALEGSINFSDKYLDGKEVNVSLKSRSRGEMELRGNTAGESGAYFISNPALKEENDDVYTLSASVSDMAGNVSAQNVVYNVNRYGSKFKFLSEGFLGKYLKSVDGDVVVRETSVSDLDLASGRVVVQKDGESTSTKGTDLKVDVSSSDSGKLIYDYNIPKGNFKEDGRYLVQVYSKTKDGVDSSSLSQEYAFVVDSVKPRIQISGVENGKSYNESSRDVTVNVVDKSGLAEVRAELNGEAVELNEQHEGYTLRLASANNAQGLVVYATDLAGNEEKVEVKDFLIQETVVESLFSGVVWWIAGGLIGVLTLFTGVLVGKRRKNQKDEAKRRETLQKMGSTVE